MSDGKLTSKGQITIPKVVREALAVYPGDRVRFVVHDDRTVTLEAETVDLQSLRGAIKSGGKHISIEQMQDAVRQGATARHAGPHSES